MDLEGLEVIGVIIAECTEGWRATIVARHPKNEKKRILFTCPLRVKTKLYLADEDAARCAPNIDPGDYVQALLGEIAAE